MSSHSITAVSEPVPSQFQGEYATQHRPLGERLSSGFTLFSIALVGHHCPLCHRGSGHLSKEVAPTQKKSKLSSFFFFILNFSLKVMVSLCLHCSLKPRYLLLFYLDSPSFVPFILSLGFFFHALNLSSPPSPSCKFF